MAKTVGYGNWDELKIMLRKSPYFRFDYMLRSRTAGELQRRVDSLIRILEKENTEKEFEPEKRRRDKTIGEELTKKKKVEENSSILEFMK